MLDNSREKDRGKHRDMKSMLIVLRKAKGQFREVLSRIEMRKFERTK